MPKGIKGFQKGYKSPTQFKKGHIVSIEMRRNISIAKTGYWGTEAQRNQIKRVALSNLGKKRPIEVIQKLSGPNHHNWQGGKSYEIYPLGWNRTFKEQIRRRDEYKCQICFVPEIECIEKLCVHHKDTNKQNITPENLISLCRPCHIKLHHNLTKAKLI